MIVVPERGGVLLEGVGAGAGGAGDEPVFGVAVVFAGGFGAVEVDAGADVGDVVAAAVQGVVDGQEVLGGELVDPFDLERLAGAGFDEGAEGGRAGVGGRRGRRRSRDGWGGRRGGA